MPRCMPGCLDHHEGASAERNRFSVSEPDVGVCESQPDPCPGIARESLGHAQMVGMEMCRQDPGDTTQSKTGLRQSGLQLPVSIGAVETRIDDQALIGFRPGHSSACSALGFPETRQARTTTPRPRTPQGQHISPPGFLLPCSGDFDNDGHQAVAGSKSRNN